LFFYLTLICFCYSRSKISTYTPMYFRFRMAFLLRHWSPSAQNCVLISNLNLRTCTAN
jgi:hypothetical protein